MPKGSNPSISDQLKRSVHGSAIRPVAGVVDHGKHVSRLPPGEELEVNGGPGGTGCGNGTAGNLCG